MTLYDTLQVAPSATADVIQSAYRALARIYHPDVNPSAEAAKRMQEINAAYAVLIDPELRAQYDARRARQARIRRGGRKDTRRGPSAPRSSPPAPPEQPAAGAISSSEPTVPLLHVCPRLGFRDDASTHFPRPTQLHACFASGRPEDASIHEQRLYCLRSEFIHCPRWLAAGQKPPTGKGQVPKGPAAGDAGRVRTEQGQPTTGLHGAWWRQQEPQHPAGGFRWAARAGAMRGWAVPVLLTAAVLLALLVALVVLLALLADALDIYDRGGALAPPVWSRPRDQSTGATRATHPASETPSVSPWACAFWRSGTGPFC
jgi:hypothetical protein